jgi:hypothetical protein
MLMKSRFFFFFYLLNAEFVMAILYLISTFTSCIIYYHATQILQIFHILQLFLLCHNLESACFP